MEMWAAVPLARSHAAQACLTLLGCRQETNAGKAAKKARQKAAAAAGVIPASPCAGCWMLAYALMHMHMVCA